MLLQNDKCITFMKAFKNTTIRFPFKFLLNALRTKTNFLKFSREYLPLFHMSYGSVTFCKVIYLMQLNFLSSLDV